MNAPAIACPIHADSGHDRPLNTTVALVSASYLPGYITLTLEDPKRLIVVRKEHLLAAIEAIPPRFANVSCSHCGQSFGPGDAGFSHCEHHAHLKPTGD